MNKFFRAVGRPFKPFLSFSTFLGTKELKESYHNVTDLTKETFARKKPEDYAHETFAEAAERLNLTKEDIAAKEKNFLLMARCYAIIGVFLFIYLLYLFFTGVWLGVFIASVLIIVAFSFSFREHFWYTEVRHRRLGLTIQEWRAYTFGRGKK